MRTAAPRLAFIDALKAIASQLIVLHHLAFYGPMSEAARDAAPGLFEWLAQDARIAVQIFLVIGGFLAAKALAPAGVLIHADPLALLKKRYIKLIIPFLAAMLISILFAAVSRQLMVDEAIPGRPTLGQFLAHAMLLHGVLGVDSLSAGAWYIAIDFQLFTLLLGVLWLARLSATQIAERATQIVGTMLVAVLGLASLFYFNRDAGWDNWALYFFGAYTLGALTYWLTEREANPGWLLLIAGVVVAALFVDFRSRILVALLTALALGISRRGGFMGSHPKGALLAWLGKISYSVFLTHFPVVLVINGVFSRLDPESEFAGLVGVTLAWAASIAAGAVFFHFIESRTRRLQELAIDPVLRVLAAYRT